MYSLVATPQVIKEALDKKFGGPWNCVAGNYFSFEVTHEVGRMDVDGANDTLLLPCLSTDTFLIKHGVGGALTPTSADRLCHLLMQCKTLLHLYIGGKIGVLTWKL